MNELVEIMQEINDHLYAISGTLMCIGAILLFMLMCKDMGGKH